MGRKGRRIKSRRAKGLWLSVCLGMAAAWCAAWLCGMIGQEIGAAGEAQGSREAGFFRGAEERQEYANRTGKRQDFEGAERGQETALTKVKGNQPGERTVALTFDDGPHEKWTPALLDGLKERGVKATFFLMGENIAGKEEIVRRMAEEGHLIGNHSYRHVQLTKAGTEEVCQAIEQTGEIIEGLIGEKPQYVRPPYGDWNEELECRTDLTTVLWDVDSLDWKSRNRDRVVQKVCREVEDGDIVLMHDIFQSSEEAALDIVDRLSAEGWRFVTVDELVVD